MPTIWMTTDGEKQKDTNKKEGKEKKLQKTKIQMSVFRILDCDTTAAGDNFT